MPGTAEARAEADWLCTLVERHAVELKAAAFKRSFQLAAASFQLHARDRNTLYRVSARFQWFLKMTPAGDEQVGRERLGATVISEALSGKSEYCGAALVRAGTNPSYVLASRVPGRPLNRVLVTNAWIPTRHASAHLERAFGTLGLLLGTLHANARVGTDAPAATKRPFDSLRGAAAHLPGGDALSEAIAGCLSRHERRPASFDFIHGNMRLDNVLLSDERIGFIDLEHCGTGSFYQDVSRPVAQLLLTRAAIGFPRQRTVAFLRAFLRRYAEVHPYDPHVLGDYVFARLAKYCVDNRRRRTPQQIGGIPILSSRLERMALTIVRDGIEGAVPELQDVYVCAH